MATFSHRVTNSTKEPLTLPFPYSGIMQPGDSVVINEDGATGPVAQAVVEGYLNVGSVSIFEQVKIYQYPGTAITETSGVRVTAGEINTILGGSTIPTHGAPVATIAALKALVPGTDMNDMQERIVEADATGNRAIYVWDSAALAATEKADDDAIVVPNAGVGKWYKSADVDSREFRARGQGAGQAKDLVVAKLGYNVATKAFTVQAADNTDPTKIAVGVLPLALAAGDETMLADDYELATTGLDTSGSAVGNPVYYDNAGALTLAAPTTGLRHVVARVLAVSAPAGAGRVRVHVEAPQKIGTDNLQDLAVTNAKIAAGTIADAKLASMLIKELGQSSISYVRFSAGEGAGASIDIDGEAYVAPGGGYADAGVAAVAYAVLVNAGTKAYAFTGNVGGNATAVLCLIKRTIGGANMVIAGGGGLVATIGAAGGSEAAIVRESHAGSHVIVADEVTALALGTNPWVIVGAFSSATAPRSVLLLARNTNGVSKAINATVSYKTVVFGAGFYGVVIKDTAATLAATDVVDFIVL